ncbi:MAG: CHAD domain-containing protein [Chlorobi bacterium]|nr:CHAD domain-containing protein [Chlorobiota bacterium]MCI0716096.1 CHAD domain-containing protein [Chlorobiota bacterium]
MSKARKIPYLNPNQVLNVCLEKILRTRFDEMISFEQGTIDGTDIEALHDMRVASRRVQAVMKIFRAAFPKKKFKTEYAEIKGLIRALGEVRDYDVFIDKLEKYNTAHPSDDKRAFDLLIIRKKAGREQKRKFLIQHINYLNKIGYKEHFYRFIYTAI